MSSGTTAVAGAAALMVSAPQAHAERKGGSGSTDASSVPPSSQLPNPRVNDLVSVTESPVVYFNSFFTGADTNTKIAQMNSWHQSLGASTARQAVQFPPYKLTHSTPIELWSGMKLVGGPAPAREYGTGPGLGYVGSGSQFAFVRNSQGYPSDGSPRDVSIIGLQFSAGSSVDWMPRNDPTSGAYQTKTGWYLTIRDCGWVGFRTIWWGWSDGSTIDGITHVQAVSDTPFFLGGSETVIGSAGYSLVDNSTAAWAASGKPFIRSTLAKSWIKGMMITAHANSTQLSIEGGQGLFVTDMAFDAQDSRPASGPCITVSGGSGVVISRCNFKGFMNAPTAAQRAPIMLTGGGDVQVSDCVFQRRGSSGSSSAPWVYAAASYSGSCAIGLNQQDGFATRRVQQAQSGRITCIDPRVSVITAV